LVIQVELHTSIQIQTPQGPVCCLPLVLAENATVADVLRELNIDLAPEHLLLVVNRQIVEADTCLKGGDKLDLIPAMSGGTSLI
jgi:sulfur carrier protein ThiS